MNDGRDGLGKQIAAAEPGEDELERQWVRARATSSLFSTTTKPATIGRFELGERLGAGGMGIVYAARDPDLDRDVAIKLVRVADPDNRDQTLAEAQSLAKLSHPNVVAIHDVGVVDDQVYMVMEFVRGQTLRTYASANSRTRQEIVTAYIQAAEGLEAAHRAGLIHRDFKPDNAVIGDDGRVRVIDFGLAHQNTSVPGSPAAGTPRYMAPEQSAGQSLTTAVDQYALCVSLREALSLTKDTLPIWLDDIVSRGESQLAEDRFDGLEPLIAALGRDPRLVRKRRLVAMAVAVSIIGAFVFGSVVFAKNPTPDPCAGGGEIIEHAWPTNTQQASLEHVAATGTYGNSLAPILRGHIKNFSSRWISAHRSACIAHLRGEQSNELLDRQMACLDRQKRGLTTFAAIMDHASTNELANLAVVAQSLPSPESCTDLSALTSMDPPPLQITAQVDHIAHEIESIRLALAAGQIEEAYNSARKLKTQARQLSYAPILAELMLLEGRAAISMWDRKAAIEPLVEATELALTVAGADAIAVEAWARRAWAEGLMKQSDDALNGLELIKALGDRVGENSFANALLYNNIGSVWIATGKREQARAAFRHSLLAAKNLTGAGALELANVHSNLAIVTTDARERDHLAVRTIERLTKLVGPTHPQTLDAIVNRAKLTLDVALGQRLLESACSLMEALHPALGKTIGRCFYELAWFAELNEDHVLTSQAITKAARPGMSSRPATQGLAALWQGNPTRAAQILQATLKEHRLPANPAWWEQLHYAEAELALGWALRSSAPPRAKRTIHTAIERLNSIEYSHPVINRRIRQARRWLTAID